MKFRSYYSPPGKQWKHLTLVERMSSCEKSSASHSHKVTSTSIKTAELLCAETEQSSGKRVPDMTDLGLHQRGNIASSSYKSSRNGSPSCSGLSCVQVEIRLFRPQLLRLFASFSVASTKFTLNAKTCVCVKSETHVLKVNRRPLHSSSGSWTWSTSPWRSGSSRRLPCSRVIN